MKNKQLLTALKTVTDFAAAQDLEPENLRCLVEYMVTHKLSITAASLHLAHKQLYENYWKAHEAEEAEKAKATPSISQTLSKATIDAMSSSELKAALRDPQTALAIENILRK
jgi:hypothetical protein